MSQKFARSPLDIGGPATGLRRPNGKVGPFMEEIS